MAPISTTITEVQQIEETIIPTKTIAFQNGTGRSMYSPPREEKRSIFHPKIGNGMPLKWSNIIIISAFHIWAVYAGLFQVQYTMPTFFWAAAMCLIAGFGVTGGVHRYWTHKTYKANIYLRSLLMICYSAAGQNTIFAWVRDHRVHHKFSDTHADPHNATNGFFFSHCGWLMQNKRPEVLLKGNQIDMSDVMADPVVQFSHKHFIPLKLIFCFIIPTMIPVYCFGEDWWNSFLAQCLVRYAITLNSTWSVNSAAHIWGWKPFDPSIKPSQNYFVAFFALGEGWHNYHHVFPWDYKAAEFGTKLNLTTVLLNVFYWIGWAWDMKEPSEELVQKVLLRNNTKYGAEHSHHHHSHPTEVPAPSS